MMKHQMANVRMHATHSGLAPRRALHSPSRVLGLLGLLGAAVACGSIDEPESSTPPAREAPAAGGNGEAARDTAAPREAMAPREATSPLTNVAGNEVPREVSAREQSSNVNGINGTSAARRSSGGSSGSRRGTRGVTPVIAPDAGVVDAGVEADAGVLDAGTLDAGASPQGAAGALR